MREEFDTGRDVILTEEHNPHDVAGLLKEFFRDLPDPLLTRDLYSAFVATRSKIFSPFDHSYGQKCSFISSSHLIVKLDMLFVWFIMKRPGFFAV